MKPTNTGHVYILEVEDIQLPVCKIGMTTRNPAQRCAEINKSSTGDFIWAVAHSIMVDDCRGMESLVHSKLAPLRQKRREFFSLDPDDAYTAMVSILESQERIKLVEADATTPGASSDEVASPRKPKPEHRQEDKEYAELLQCFSSLLGIKGRPFGQTNRETFGLSDGNQGVQWNLSVMPATEEVRLGVNLEGSEKTGKWLVSRFILSKPSIDELKARVADQENLSVCFFRDAWQGAARVNIVEEYIGGRAFSLAELDSGLWDDILEEALTCLDEDRNYQKRKPKKPVTLKSDGRKMERDISPHLTIRTLVSMDGDIEANLKAKIDQMKPVHDWVVRSCAG